MVMGLSLSIFFLDRHFEESFDLDKGEYNLSLDKNQLQQENLHLNQRRHNDSSPSPKLTTDTFSLLEACCEFLSRL